MPRRRAPEVRGMNGKVFYNKTSIAVAVGHRVQVPQWPGYVYKVTRIYTDGKLDLKAVDIPTSASWDDENDANLMSRFVEFVAEEPMKPAAQPAAQPKRVKPVAQPTREPVQVAERLCSSSDYEDEAKPLIRGTLVTQSKRRSFPGQGWDRREDTGGYMVVLRRKKERRGE